MAVGIRCADHVTPLYPQKFALTSPTGGGRSVGIVRSRTKATEFLVIFSVMNKNRGCMSQYTVTHNTTRYISIRLLVSDQYVVARLIEALRYKPEGLGLDSRLYQWNYSLT